jgi:hypothetical protein
VLPFRTSLEGRLSTDQSRLRVLLCWGYHRSGWIAPFERLRDRFELNYLFYRSAEEEEACLTDAPRYYWSQFASGQDLLHKLKPARIVFMALDGAWSIALNAAARHEQIPTLIVQHGHLESEADAQRVGTVSALAEGSPLPALRFAARSFGLRNAADLPRLVRFMSDARRHSARAAMPRHRFRARMPDRYVALSPESAGAIQRLDGATESEIACIGIPEFDELFRSVEPGAPGDGSVLLLDSPNAENRWGVTTMTLDGKIGFLRELETAASALGGKLRVKLHPETYGAAWLPNLEHGVYLRDADLVREFNEASVCVGFDSTLLIPAVWLRPTILVGHRPSRIVDLASETGAAMVVPPDYRIRPSELNSAKERHTRSDAQRNAYIERLAFRPDGRAIERLADVLGNPHVAPERYPISQWRRPPR